MEIMADSIPQKETAEIASEQNIVVRTMKGDLEKLSGVPKKEIKEPEKIPIPPIAPISQESQVSIPKTPLTTRFEPPKITPPSGRPPVLVIPPKEIPPLPTAPLFKATPVWIKIGAIGLGIAVLALAGLYGYWKIFIQGQPTPPTTPIATTTVPVLPTTPVATTTPPIKFLNKLPNKEVTIDIFSKTSNSLVNALKSEMEIKITFQGKPITTEEFFSLMSIFTPKDFLKNYENEFALAFFGQKEGARPILILKAKNRAEMETQMKSWEKTLSSDVFPMFLSDGKLPKVLSLFKSYLFIGQPVRYLNINIPFASLNYTTYNNFLVFTTSSAGMFVILQDLTGQTVSANYLENLKASINEFVK